MDAVPRALLLLLLPLLTGCLSSDLLITVRADGSGTVTHTLKAFKSADAALNQLIIALEPASAGALREAIAAQPPRDRFPEREAASTARYFGPAVRFVSTRSLASADVDGREYTYAFENVKDLSVDLVPRFPDGGSFGWAFTNEPLESHLAFDIGPHENGNTVVTIRFPDQRMDPGAVPLDFEKPSKNTPEQIALFRAYTKGARVRLAVQTESALVRTNSPYREDNRVLLLDLDIEKIALSDDIDRLEPFRPASFDEVRWALHDLPGAKIALDREITLEFETPPSQSSTPPPPDTEIYLASLSSRDGTVAVGSPSNITLSKGYDNQPSFTPDGSAILFTSARAGTAIDATRARPPQTDVYRYDVAAQKTTRVTETPESEYSPTVTPDGTHISVVRVAADGTQRLWQLRLDGGDPIVLLPDIQPVGYHAWADVQSVALFVLGAPPTLQLADTARGTAVVLARDVGRSLQRMPSGGISYVQRDATSGSPRLMVMALDARTRSTQPLVPLMPGATDPALAWTPDGTLLVADHDWLYQWRAGSEGWTRSADLGRLGLHGVTRLAVSPRGDRIAIVAQPQ